jgi:hypothetical protein
VAVRLRKLAKELGRSVLEVVGVLHAVGLVQYKSAEDMLPDPAGDRLRKALRDGVRAAPLPPDVVAAIRAADGRGAPNPPVAVAVERLAPPALARAPVPSGRAPAPGRATADPRRAPDLMSQLVPGITRAGQPASPARAAPRPGGREVEVEVTPVERGAALSNRAGPDPFEAERRALETERAMLESLERRVVSERATTDSARSMLEMERHRLESDHHALEAERSGLLALREALAFERQALDEERAALEAERGRRQAVTSVAGTPLVALLEQRGLKGLDEFERALAALASTRSLRDVLFALRVEPPDLIERLLVDRLLLVGSDPPRSLPRSFAQVAVSPERSEVPDASDLTREMDRLSSALLLNGFRRVLIIGGRPVWQRVVRDGIDYRVDVRFAPSTRAADEVTQPTDAIIAWGAPLDERARATAQRSRITIIDVRESTVGALVADALRAISAD